MTKPNHIEHLPPGQAVVAWLFFSRTCKIYCKTNSTVIYYPWNITCSDVMMYEIRKAKFTTTTAHGKDRSISGRTVRPPILQLH